MCAEKPSSIASAKTFFKERVTQAIAGPPTAVLDTNVLLDLLWFCDARVRSLAQALDQGALVALSCPAVRSEFAHQLNSPRLAAWAGAGGVEAAVSAALARHDRWVLTGPDPAPAQPLLASLRCTDPDDQIFIDLALARRASCLLSHDRALLKLARPARRLGLRIATPYQWSRTAAA
jgi:predicted nucleic acid-binding protein